MIIPSGFEIYYLCDFEDMGGKWESIKVTKRNKYFTERLCKLTLEDAEGTTYIRFYNNGLAMIGVPFVDAETEERLTEVKSSITKKMDEPLYSDDKWDKQKEITKKRHAQLYIYTITSIITWIIIAALFILILFKKLTLLVALIGTTLLLIHLLAKRMIWYEKIMLLGSEGHDYYEKYK